MRSSPSRYFVLLLLCAGIALPLRSQENPSAKRPAAPKSSGHQKKAVTSDGKKAVEVKKGDLSSLPSDAVIVVCEHADEGLDLVPKAVLLRPDKYQELVEQIEKLKKEIDKLKSENALPPTRCSLRGKIGSKAVRVSAEFAGTVEHADTWVSLACPQGAVSSAETDGRLSVIRRSNAGGFLVRIEKAGDYHVKLDLVLPLSGREGNSRGVELTLPRAVITEVDMELPPNCTEVRVGGQLLKDLQLSSLELSNNHLKGNPALGPVDKLELSWQEARHSAGEPVRTAEGRIQARLDAAGLSTEADLSLTVEGSPTRVWQLLLPRNAEIKLIPADGEDRIEHRVDADDQKYAFASLRTIHLKEPRSEPLHVQVKLPLLPLRNSLMPVGPFFVLDTVRQIGTVQVRNQVRGLQLHYHGHGDMQRRRQEAEELKGDASTTVATLVYSKIPMVEKPEETFGPRSLSWLDLEAVKVQANARMRLTHTLMLRPVVVEPSRDSEINRRESRPVKQATDAPAFQWAISTTISPATRWTEVDQLKIIVPQEWEPKDGQLSYVPNSNSRCVIVPSSLLREAPTQPYQLEGRYRATYKTEGRTALKLPSPQGTIESCEVKIDAPADIELVVGNSEQLFLELSRQPRPNEQTWRSRGTQGNELGIEVSWKPYRPELRAVSIVDLTLNGNYGEVHHELRLQLPPTPPPFLTLRVPAGIGDNLQIQDERGQPVRSSKAEMRNPKSDAPIANWEVRLPLLAQDGGRELRLSLRYTTRLGEKEGTPPAGEPFLVPLVAPEQATAVDVKVRIWSELGFLPRVVGSRWEEQRVEEVKDRDFPILVLHSARQAAPLRLVLSEQTAGASTLVESARMHVQLEEGGAQSWRASFRLRQLADRDLDLLMPGPVATLDAQFTFNRHKVTAAIVNTQGELSAGGNIARLHLPFLHPLRESAEQPGAGHFKTASLDVTFQAQPGRGVGQPLNTILQPPRILRATTAPTYWRVSVPANRVLLAPESSAGIGRTWERRNWLFAAGLSIPSSPRYDNETAALVCWQDDNEPVVLTHVPKQAWLLVCSLGLLSVGLGLFWSVRPHANEGRRSAPWIWPILAAITMGSAVAALFWPGLMCAILYGCEPGAVVLAAYFGLQWLLQHRYRRQIVFLPSFSRGRANSSLIRKSPSPRPQAGEPSTVDAPPPSVG